MLARQITGRLTLFEVAEFLNGILNRCLCPMCDAKLKEDDTVGLRLQGVLGGGARELAHHAQSSTTSENLKGPEQPQVNPISKRPRWTRAQGWQLFRQCMSELLGTALVCFAAIRSTEVSSASIPKAVILSSALVLAIWLAGPVSGGHVNPSVTLAFCLCRIVSFVYLPIYWTAQFLGGLCGSALALVFLDGRVLPSDAINGSETVLGSVPLQVLAEYLSSTTFNLIVLVSADSRRPDAWSGCGFNTSMAIGLMAMVNALTFIHTFVPFLGSISAAFLFQFLLCPDAGRRRTVAYFKDRHFDHDRNYSHCVAGDAAGSS
ncbi:unnamed protein product [Schistocephalus solidus]|uniref:Aquaporin-4 n=1 Tax=Schistocephalus solidus TaxID=70667 RepID=A0A183T7P4_SCHSO|nr:unnamed protein product [Schistocephalus solidus]